MSDKSYERLHRWLQDLIRRGTKVADKSTGTPAAQIHEWIKGVEDCLLQLEDKMPKPLSDFRRIRPSFEFKVDEDEEALSSESAYRPQGAAVLLDFKFDCLKKANRILKFAATKLEIEGPETLGEQLRAARLRAGQSQRKAAEEIGYDHKAISEWETGKRKPNSKTVQDIRGYILKHPESK